jgi:hypothetical protein
VKAAQETRGENFAWSWRTDLVNCPKAEKMQQSDFEVYRVEADGSQPFVGWLDQTSQAFRLAYVRAFFAFTRNGLVRRKVRTANEIPQPFIFAYAC